MGWGHCQSLFRAAHFESRCPTRMEDTSASYDAGFIRDESIVANHLTQLCQRHRVIRGEVEDRQAVIQTNLHRRDAGHLLHSHAHGVGAGLSIHTQGFHLDVTQLRLSDCRAEGQHHGEGDRFDPHLDSYLNQK